MTLPNLIIPGAQKSGTTALRIYLSQHPDIHMIKREIHFFDNEENYGRGIEWYKRFFDSWAGERVIGEKTPEYMYNEKAPKRMHTFLPQVRLVLVLRNPVDRAYSHYWHNRRVGRESLSFEKAIEKEEERCHADIGNRKIYSYKERGKYIEQIKRYVRFFPKNNMVFVTAESLREHTREVLSNILDFLEVNSDFEFADLEKKHVGGIPRSKYLSKLAGNDFIARIKYLKWGIKWINMKKVKPSMREETRTYLQKYFESYNSDLERFTGLDLKKWKR